MGLESRTERSRGMGLDPQVPDDVKAEELAQEDLSALPSEERPVGIDAEDYPFDPTQE